LRRLWTKHPYFTNGSADDLDHVLRGIVLGEGPAADVHGDPDAPGVRRLGVQERAAMAAFLDTL
jgi:hypothetical protein